MVIFSTKVVIGCCTFNPLKETEFSQRGRVYTPLGFKSDLPESLGSIFNGCSFGNCPISDYRPAIASSLRP